MAAAQAAAEAALQEARAREQATRGSYPQDGQEDPNTGNDSPASFLATLQAANAGGPQDHLIRELLGLPMNTEEGTTSQLFQLLAQQQQSQFSGGHQPMFNTRLRPNKHYLTIAQNGAYDEYASILSPRWHRNLILRSFLFLF